MPDSLAADVEELLIIWIFAVNITFDHRIRFEVNLP